MTDYVNPNAIEFDNEEENISINPDPIGSYGAVINASDWTTETLINQLKRGNILLNPDFQRRDAWSISRKSKFIESLILGLPIPQIVLAETKEKRGCYLVLDGKQRLLTLLQFTGLANKHKNNKFKLKGVDVLTDLENVTFKELENEAIYDDILASFQNQTIRSVVIRNWPNTDFLHLLFLRLNTGSVQLSPQELRLALFPGEFSSFAVKYSETSITLQKLLRLSEPDFRMRDVELVIRYLSFINFLPKYKGNLKQFLDDTCEELNASWDKWESKVDEQIKQLEYSIDVAIEIFGDEDVARMPYSKGNRRPFNRAIFDILVFYFRSNQIREKSKEKPEEIKELFNNLWAENKDFSQSMQTTTKSIGATISRLSIWGKALRTLLGIDFPVPELADESIVYGEEL